MTEQPEPARPKSHLAPIDEHLAYINGQLRMLAARASVALPAGIEGLKVVPQTYPGAAISDDTYGDRTGNWGDGVDWLEYWAGLGGSWVNLGIITGADGDPAIAYETQWRKGDPIEPIPGDGYPAINFHG